MKKQKTTLNYSTWRMRWKAITAFCLTFFYSFLLYAQTGDENKMGSGMMGGSGRMCECPSMKSHMHGATGIFFGVLIVALLLSAIAALITLSVFFIRRSRH